MCHRLCTTQVAGTKLEVSLYDITEAGVISCLPAVQDCA